MTEAIENVLAVLDEFRMSDEITYSAYSALHDEISLLDDLLKEQKSEWLEDSDPGQEYGTTWACAECGRSIYVPIIWNPYRAGFKYCPFCGDRMVLKRDD